MSIPEFVAEAALTGSSTSHYRNASRRNPVFNQQVVPQLRPVFTCDGFWRVGNCAAWCDDLGGGMISNPDGSVSCWAFW